MLYKSIRALQNDLSSVTTATAAQATRRFAPTHCRKRELAGNEELAAHVPKDDQCGDYCALPQEQYNM